MLMSRITRTLFRHDIITYHVRNLSDYVIRRKPLRFYDENGREVTEEWSPGVRRIDPKPKPISSEFVGVQKPKNRMRKRFVKRETASDINKARQFVKDIIDINNGKEWVKEFVVLEGQRLIEDATTGGARFHHVYYSNEKILQSSRLAQLFSDENLPRTKISESDMKLLSTVVTPPGVIAICRKPNYKDLESARKIVIPITLIADVFRDPGNAGGLVRSASAAGIEKVEFSAGSVNVWDPKVTRTAMGTHWKIPLFTGSTWDMIAKRLENYNVFYADNSQHHDSVTYDKATYFDESKKPVALVIGGEANGFSDEALRSLSNLKAQPINIPMHDGIESLNGYVAASIILYEMRRQFIRLHENK